MTRPAAAAALLLVLALFVLWLGGRLDRDIGQMTGLLDNAEKEASAEEWDNAQNSLQALDEMWSHAQPIYRITLEQRIIDNAETMLQRLRAAAGNKDKELFVADAASLRCFWEEILRMEGISWDTVL